MRGHRRRDVEAAERAAEDAGVAAAEPAEPIAALALRALNEMAAAAEKEDGARIRIGEVDGGRDDGDGDPAVGLQLRVDVRSAAAIGLASVPVGGGALHAAILEPAIEHDLGLGVIGKRALQ